MACGGPQDLVRNWQLMACEARPRSDTEQSSWVRETALPSLKALTLERGNWGPNPDSAPNQLHDLGQVTYPLCAKCGGRGHGS